MWKKSIHLIKTICIAIKISGRVTTPLSLTLNSELRMRQRSFLRAVGLSAPGYYLEPTPESGYIGKPEKQKLGERR